MNTAEKQRALNTVEDVISSMKLEMHTDKVDVELPPDKSGWIPVS